MPQLSIRHESWPIAGSFTIARGAKTVADVVVVTLTEHSHTGRGECVPYARYGETVPAVIAEIEAARSVIEAGLDRQGIASRISLKAARNALDCAMWDLEAKRTDNSVWQLAGMTRPVPRETAFTISLGPPEVMAGQAALQDRNLLKLKLGRDDDAVRLQAIRAAVPAKRLIVDANEGWNSTNIEAMLAACAAAGVELVEQPLPAADDAVLAKIAHPVTICADESVHGLESLAGLAGKYDAINIKLDKTGGLTAALDLVRAGEANGFQLMVGCMLATSLSMAPAFLVAQRAQYVDLDGPLLLHNDRSPGIRYDGAMMFEPPPELWG